MFLYTTDFISGKNIETIQMVRGMSCRSYTTDAMPQAEERMVKEAEKLGADAIVDVSYTLSEIVGSCTVVVSGTAVKFVEETENAGPRRVSVKLVD